MARKDQFPNFEAEHCIHLMRLWAEKSRRRIESIHIHCTDHPNHSDFDAYAKLHHDHAAGEEMCRRMWRYHTSKLGWSDIAQHVSVDPRGVMWVGRDWDRTPASARGHNGGPTRGPFMIEMIGLFDVGEDRFDGSQKYATHALIAALQDSFGLSDQNIVFHNALTNRKTCPGNAIDHAEFLKDQAEWRQAHPAPQAMEGDTSGGPMPTDQIEKPEESDDAKKAGALLSQARTRWQAVTERGARSGFIGGEELPSCSGSDAVLPEPKEPDTDARGGMTAKPSISAAEFRRVRKHLLMLEEGQVRKTPYLDDMPCTVDELRDSLVRWLDDLPKTANPKIVLWAHGGLVPVDGAVRYASEMHKWWKDHDIYPIFFIWDTGFLSVIGQVLRDMLLNPFSGTRSAEGGAPMDGTVEAIVRTLGVPFWQTIKTTAERASDGRLPGGAFELIKMLGDVTAQRGADAPPLHGVGHSAGAVFHSHMIEDLHKHDLALDSLTLLAPACTVDLFARKVVPHIGVDKTVRRCRVFNLHRSNEIADPTVDFYGKSLLYLVSNGFEGAPDVPLLGLEESLRRAPAMRKLFGMNGQESRAELILTPADTHPDEPENHSRAQTHGAFDNDHATLRSVLHTIDPDLDPGDVPTPPIAEDVAVRGGGGMLFPPLETQVADLLPLGAPMRPIAQNPAALSTPVVPRPTGRRYALSIGIDAYTQVAPLRGCENDVAAWSQLLERGQFKTTRLTGDQTKGRRIHDALQALVDQARAGDVVAIHYSGHGTRVPDLDGDETIDFQDEALVPIDGAITADFLIDDDRFDLLDSLAQGVDCTLFFDCCHSNTSTRVLAPRRDYTERFIALDQDVKDAYRRKRATQRGRRRSNQHRNAGNMNHLLFSACRESQTAKESNGNGWFSTVATTLLNEGNPGSNEALLNAIRKEFEKRGYSADNQTPMLDGPDHLRNGPVLGGIFG